MAYKADVRSVDVQPENQNNGKGKKSMGFIELLTLVFIVLKLIGVITWSWWIVLSPMLITTAIVIVIIILLFILLKY